MVSPVVVHVLLLVLAGAVSLIVAFIAGLLALLAGESVPRAVLTGGGAGGGTFGLVVLALSAGGAL